MTAQTTRAIAMQRYYFPIIHNGQLQVDDEGEQFSSADLASDYGARIARDIGSDPEYDPVSGTIVIVVDGDGSEIARHVVDARTENAGTAFAATGLHSNLRMPLK
ncbi:hypothetical protein ACVIIW_006209 [Bradyrhizobium sp. USDA 4449]